ncbi:MAG: hypothetical protein AAFW89_01020 [Bacteroidota bacterium]
MENATNTNQSINNWATAFALFTSILALFISIYETTLQRTENQAMVWPHVTIDTIYNGEGFSMAAENKGIGPALITSMEVTYKDSLILSMDALLDAVKPGREMGYDVIRMGTLNNTVLSPGESRIILRLPWTDETRAMVNDLRDADLTIEYCSVLNDCWTFNKQTNTHEEGRFNARLEFED